MTRPALSNMGKQIVQRDEIYGKGGPLAPLQSYHHIALIKFAWYMLRVKNLHSGLHSDPLGTHLSVSLPPQCPFIAVVCISTPRITLKAVFPSVEIIN